MTSPTDTDSGPRHPVLRYDLTHLEFDVRGGHTLDGIASLRGWSVTARLPSIISQWGVNGEATTTVPPEHHFVASMSVVSADPLLGDIVQDADDHSQALSDVASALPDLDGDTTDDEFFLSTATPILLIDEFVVARPWSGTALSPALAILMLWPLVSLGARRIALKAHPILHGVDRADISEDEVGVRRVARHLEAMWRPVGITNTSINDVMYAVLDTDSLRNSLRSISDAHPELVELTYNA